jgi:hypothetical protein
VAVFRTYGCLDKSDIPGSRDNQFHSDLLSELS